MSTGNELVKACDEYLTLKRIFHYRQNTGAVKMPHGSFIRYGTKGAPDIVAIKNGTYIGIECKMGSGRQSPAQKEFQHALENAGGTYLLVRSVDDVINHGL